MSAQVSEAIILRTYPLREADLIVSFFTRDLGKLRGVARRARRPSSRFGSGLERLAYVRMHYFQRENRELATLDACELVRPPLALSRDYATSVAGDFVAEVAEQMLPAGEPNERFFRLTVAVTDFLAGGGSIWPAAVYFSLWAVRLAGVLPPLALSEEDRTIAEEMLATPIGELTSRDWTRETGVALRHSLIGLMEEHTERRLVTVKFLEAL
jgi:DNA repair protein RecO (recombination protein O)